MSFPTSPLLDDANRANENPISQGGNWIGKFAAAHGDLKVLSNQIAGHVTGAVWNSAIYDMDLTDCEMHTTVVVEATLHEFFLRVTDENTGSENGYGIAFVIDGYWVRSFSAGAPTDLIALDPGTRPLVIAAGDEIGAAAIGDDIQVWHKPAAGSWTMVDSITDSTHSSGRIGLAVYGDVGRVDDVYGGGSGITLPPTDVTAKNAVLHGFVDPTPSGCDWMFEMGETVAYEHGWIGGTYRDSTEGADEVSFDLKVDYYGYDFLVPETTYHYRLIIYDYDLGDYIYGNDVEFTTLAIPNVIKVNQGGVAVDLPIRTNVGGVAQDIPLERKP